MAGRANHGRRAAAQLLENHSLDKTRACRFFARGLCSRGSACSFAHGPAELLPQPNLYRTGLCFDYLKTGYCWAGAGCKFAHSAEDLRLAELADGPAEAAPPGTAVVAGQVRAVQRQLALLAAQLEAMRQLAAAARPRGRPAPGCRGSLAAAGGEALAGRAHDPDVSTDDEEGEDPHSSSLARQVSEGSDEWETGSAWQAGDTSGSTRNFAASAAPKPERFVITVKNTFLEVQWEPVAPAAAKSRSRSAPTGRCCGLTEE